MKYILPFNFLMPLASNKLEGKTFRNLLVLVVVIVFGGTMTGQVFSGTYSFASANGNVASLTYNGTAISNLTVGSLVKTGVTTASSSGNSRSTGWSTGSTDSGSAGGSVDLGKYYEFTITAGSGYTISNPTLTYGVGRSGTGPRRFQWRWDIDLYGSALLVGTANAGITNTLGVLETPDANSGYTGNVITASTSGQTSITFRFYAYGSESATGTGGLHGDLTFGGTLSSSNPTIFTSGTPGPFVSTGVSTPSSEQSFTVSGSNLTNDIVITPPTGYQISTSTGGSFSPTNPITLSQSGGTVASTTIYARFNPTALVDQVGGNIAISSTGATTQNVAVSGEVTNLSAGAIAFIAFQGATTDLYRIVALNDIPNNTRIWFTDKSWDGGTLSFFSGEGNNVWTNTTGSAIAAGTVIQFDAAGGATLGTGGLNSGLGSAGEQLFAYQGTLTSPTFVAGYTSGTVITTGVTTATSTYVPSGLTSGTNFVALGDITFGSSYVTAATHNRSLADMRSHIHNIANLTTGNTSTTTNGNWPTYTFNFSNDWIGANGNWNTAGNWSFATVPSSIDHVTISSGSPVLDVDYTLPVGKTFTLSGTGGLTINPGKVLTIAGTADFGGNVVTFKSDATGTAMLGTLTGTLTNATNVKVERYIPAKRAYRFVSSSVTTTTTIKENWQENAGTTAGLGTHITGTGGASNGFDVTSTNNPSMYTFTGGAWAAVTNTNVDVLTAGTPYRLMVRGDRTIDLTNNSPTATPTTLRATGTLRTGNFTPTINQTADGFSLVGNPYQAPIDIKAILTGSSNMNTGVVYYWDPTLNARGGYVTRNLTTDVNDVASAFNQYVQPGQAVFVKRDNTANVASVSITESNKSVANGSAGLFRSTTSNDYGFLRVNLQANVNNEWQAIEGALALFNPSFSASVTQEDATKMSNLDEEVSFIQNNTPLAIACQPNPSITDELPIKINNLRHSNYQWQFDLTNYDGVTPYLFDAQNNTYTEIADGSIVPFMADVNTVNRFKVVFQNAALSNPEYGSTIVMYPNPAKRGSSFILQGVSSQSSVVMYNTLGQTIAVSTKENEAGLQVTPIALVSTGVYIVSITSEGKTSQVKWIVE
jgi:hypothetical protein